MIRAIPVCKGEWVIKELQGRWEILALLVEMDWMELPVSRVPKVQKGIPGHQELTDKQASSVHEVLLVQRVPRERRVTPAR